jgi:hypothetical protein
MEQQFPLNRSERSDTIVSSEEEEAKQTLLANIGRGTREFVLEPDTMFQLAFGVWIQVIRLLVVLLAWYLIKLVKPTTHMSRLDQQWLDEFFELFTVFLLVINLIFVLPFLLEAPKLLFVVTRLIFGGIGACVAHMIKGFSLYDSLTVEEMQEGQDMKALYYIRFGLLWFLLGFTIYMLTSCVCVTCILDLCDDGGEIRQGQGRKLKKIPFGSLLFNEDLDCSICLSRFRQHSRVVQLSCHHSHVFHSRCIREWIESGHTVCPLCRK